MFVFCLLLNIFYCYVVIAFRHFYFNVAPFMAAEKIPFTSSQTQSGNLGCVASHHLCARPVPLQLFDSFMVLIYSQAVAI